MFRTHFRRAVAVALLAVFAAASPGDAQEARLEHFITARGNALFDGERPLRFISFNIPNLLVVEDAFSFTDPNPWRWPDEFEIEDALESVRQQGGQVVRTYVISVRRADSDMGDCVHVLGPGEFNEEGFRALDKVLEVADRKGIRVLVPLVDNWKWMGGIAEYAAFRGKKAEEFWSDPELIADFKQTLQYVINRKNALTGRRYRDEPAIFGWETGNEIDATPGWTREIAAFIRGLDPNHLIVDGRTLHGIADWQLDEPNTDVLSTHHYPHASPDFVPPIRAAHVHTKGRKPYFVGEFGFVEPARIRSVVDAVIEDGIPGALLWSLRFHRREGGFYWHMEVGSGRNIYKAYHWPGFDSGAAYDEREVLAMMRAKAFEIQGREPPPLEAPAPPKLLPIEHPALISWQGSAGAAAYDVERSESPDGPWDVVGKNVCDAFVQYRPLLSDQSAESGRGYHYRVVARNAADDSEASNVVGPVTSAYRMLVDECAELGSLHESAGDVAVRSENARLTQEDIHRFALAPGAAIVYRVDGPIRAWRVFAFASSDDVELVVTASTDGDKFSRVNTQKQSFAAGAGDYGYLAPVLFSGDSPTEETHTYLKIAAEASGTESAPLQISRVEIDYGSKAP